MKLKQGGGNAGHNGLKDITQKTRHAEFSGASVSVRVNPARLASESRLWISCSANRLPNRCRAFPAASPPASTCMADLGTATFSCAEEDRSLREASRRSGQISHGVAYLRQCLPARPPCTLGRKSRLRGLREHSSPSSCPGAAESCRSAPNALVVFPRRARPVKSRQETARTFFPERPA